MLFNIQSETWKQYEEIVANEEILWYQKSRAKWLEFRDRNTRYFHGVTTIRRRRNHILALQNDQGQWIREQDQLECHAIEFYANLFKNDSHFIPFCVQGRFASLTEEEYQSLAREVTLEEIFKAPGPDGFQAIFYHSNWDIVGHCLMNLICKIWREPWRIKTLMLLSFA